MQIQRRPCQRRTVGQIVDSLQTPALQVVRRTTCILIEAYKCLGRADVADYSWISFRWAGSIPVRVLQ